MFCNKCGNQMLEGAQFCAGCGAPAIAAEIPPQPEQTFEQAPEQLQAQRTYAPPPYPAQQQPYAQPYPQQPYGQQPYPPQQPYPQQPYGQPYPYAPPPVEDVPNTGLNVLSFFIPLVGFIMYATTHQQTPVKAKAMLKMAIIGLCVSVGLIILFTVLGVLIPTLLYL